ncbi:MAG: HAMP domain-containing histidine kinase, partial [Rhodospirillaceae bacterium]|nr:HAMP domain-containing histidine kinase [Rhodospirillaceae bacterium]
RDGDWLYVSAFDAAKDFDRREFRARSFVLRGNFRLLVGRDIRARGEFQSAMIQSLGWALAVTFALGIAGGYFMSRRMLRRVDGVAAASREIIEGDLSRRMPVSGSGDEFDRLSDTLNHMLAEIEHLLTGMRTVTDSVTHDLKSPLTRLKSNLELALRQRSPEAAETRRAVTRAIAEADAVLATFDALIAIARAEAGTGRAAMESVDLSAVVNDMADLYGPLAEHKGVSLILNIAEGCRITGHRQFLSQAVGNLLDNAVKFTPSGGSIAIALGRNPDQLIISDSGPGIPAADRARVLQRFVRLDVSRSAAGSGLGLSLVAGVAKLHGAELELSDSDLRGLSVQLTF